MNVVKSLFGAAALTAFASFAHATTVTQLIHFDDAGGGASDYTTADGNFYFTPTNFQSGLCADSTSGGNGKCVIEGKGGNGILPMMTRLGDNDIFSLDSFYFLLTGKGEGSENAITATASLNGVQTGTATFELDSSYLNVIKYDDGTAAGTLMKGIGYIADLTSLTGFQDIDKIQFSAPSTAQLRLDCVVATFEGTTTESISSFKSGCGLSDDGGGGGGNIPLPAGLPLLISALGLGGILRHWRRRSV